MEIIFRQVKCSERKPKESGSYLTYVGYKWFNLETGGWTTHCPSNEGRENQILLQLRYWLEAVELPSDEEVKEQKWIDCKNDDGISKPYWDGKEMDGFIKGVKWMRDFVLAVTPNEVQK